MNFRIDFFTYTFITEIVIQLYTSSKKCETFINLRLKFPEKENTLNVPLLCRQLRDKCCEEPGTSVQVHGGTQQISSSSGFLESNSDFPLIVYIALRDWSLIMGRGGYKTGGGGRMKFYPYKKGGGGKSFSHAEEGVQKVFGYFFRSSLKF